MNIKLNEKLKKLITKKYKNLSRFHRELKNVFKDKSVAYLTLYRTVNGTTEVRESTLFQIATTLGISLPEIKKDTERPQVASTFHYNAKASLKIINSPENFLTAELVLLSGARTKPEQDPKEKADFAKWIYGLQGEIICIVLTPDEVQKKCIKKGESFHFKSSHPHYFENNTKRKSSCLVIQNPKYI